MCKNLLTRLARRLYLSSIIMQDEHQRNEEIGSGVIEFEAELPATSQGGGAVEVEPADDQNADDLYDPSDIIIGSYNLKQIGEARAILLGDKQRSRRRSIIDRIFRRSPE